MLDFVIGSQGASDVMQAISLLIISGLSMRYSLTLTGQVWAKTYQQTIAFIILPVVTYVITKTISGNIALSLGMIGAMSIVRFRNPVKSALELIMYFALITIGIAASVRTKYAILLVLVMLEHNYLIHHNFHYEILPMLLLLKYDLVLFGSNL